MRANEVGQRGWTHGGSQPYTVPALLRGALYGLLVGGGLAGLPQLGGFGPLPMSLLLDVWMILFLCWAGTRGVIMLPKALAIVLAFAFTRLVGVLATDSPIEDSLQAYKWLLYLCAFIFALGKVWWPISGLARLTWILVLMALGKAAATWVVMGPGERPGLLVENNFEIALFAGLTAVLYRRMGRYRLLLVGAMAALIVLSGSRSGAVVFLILVIYVLFQTNFRSLLGRYVSLLVVVAASSIPIAIFESRGQGGAKIDRLNFFEVFRIEVANWSPWEWVFGTVPITALEPGSCSRLSYYQSLFSTVGDGTCYSVVLHAFLLRVVFDAGILGLLLVFGVAWLALRKSGNPLSLTACLIAIAVANGASVSGLNNPYVALPILLAILSAMAPKVAASSSERHGSAHVRGSTRSAFLGRASRFSAAPTTP